MGRVTGSAATRLLGISKLKHSIGRAEENASKKDWNTKLIGMLCFDTVRERRSERSASRSGAASFPSRQKAHVSALKQRTRLC